MMIIMVINFTAENLKGLNVNKYLSKIKNDKRFKKVKNIYSHLKNDKNLFENSELYERYQKIDCKIYSRSD